jgi:hypothetical protein
MAMFYESLAALSFNKPIFIACYLTCGMLMVLMACGGSSGKISAKFLSAMTPPGRIIILLIALWMFHQRLLDDWKAAIAVGLAAVAVSVRQKRVCAFDLQLCVSMLVTLSVVLSLDWWIGLPDYTVHPAQAAAFVGIIVLAYQVMALADRHQPVASLAFKHVVMMVFVSGAVCLLANVAPLEAGSADRTAGMLHHWGAYIGSSEQILDGLIPLYDIPVQYGLGPAVMIAGVCKAVGCWPGMFFLVVVTNTVMGAAILSMAIADVGNVTRNYMIFAAVGVFLAVYYWTNYPHIAYNPIVSPSTGGLRFLPATLVAWSLIRQQRWPYLVILPLAAIWNPESAFFSGVICGMYFLMLRGVLRAATYVAVGATVFLAWWLAVYRLSFSAWPDPLAYVEYVLHPPGRLPVNPLGPVWLLGGVFLFALAVLARCQSKDATYRSDVVALALLFAASSYFLGRSHDNNICNLMPFITLVALRLLRRLEDEAGAVESRRILRVALAATLALPAFAVWSMPPFINGFSADIAAVTARFATIFPDLTAAHRSISNPEALGIADFASNYNRSSDETTVWTALDPVSVFYFVPADRRRIYVLRAAQRLQRPGYIVMEETPQHEFEAYVEDIKAAYDVDVVAKFTAPQAPGTTSPRSSFTIFKARPRQSVVAP